MTIDHIALAASHGQSVHARRPLVQAIRPGEMQQYRDAVVEYLDLESTRRYASDQGLLTLPTVDQMLDSPNHRTTMVPAFFAWLRDNNRPPFTDGAAPVRTGELYTVDYWANQAMYDAVAFRRIDRDWLRELRPAFQAYVNSGASRHSVESFNNAIANPGGSTTIIRPFMQWLSVNRRHIPAPVTTPAAAAAAAVPQGDGFDWAGAANEEWDGPIRRAMTREQFAAYEPAVRAWFAEVGPTAAHLRQERGQTAPEFNAISGFLHSPAEYSDSFPAFAAWVVANPNHPTLPGRRPAVPTVEQFLAFTAAEWAPYRDDLIRFLPMSQEPSWGRTPEEGRINVDAILGMLPSREYTGEGTRGVLRQFAVAVNDGSFVLDEPATPVTTVAPAVALPTSPKQAFPTRAEMQRAYNEWASSTDERLPDDMNGPHHGNTTAGSSNYRRSRIRSGETSGWSGMYQHEISVAWDADDFAHQRSHYANGFWRDVRDLGWGTPAWGQATTAAAAVLYDVNLTREQVAADHVRLLTPIAEQFREWARTANKRYAWVEWMLTGGDVQEHGRTVRRDYWSSDQTGNLNGWVEWARANAHRFVAEGAVPQGDGIIPVGPEHPGWNDWWISLYNRAQRNNYPSYYRRLAEAMGGPLDPNHPVPNPRPVATPAPAPVQRTVRVTLEVPVGDAVAMTEQQMEEAALAAAAAGRARYLNHAFVTA